VPRGQKPSDQKGALPGGARTEEDEKKEQEWLDEEAKRERRTDGGYNTTVAVGDYIWRVSRGNNQAKRERHLKEWIEEAELSRFFGRLGIAPDVVRGYADGSKWLVGKQKRVALLQHRYTEDLADALLEKEAKVFLGNDASFGTEAGRYLVRRCCQLGAVCMLHADLKPENVLVMLKEKPRDLGGKVSALDDLRIIDFDPQFLYGGCACVSGALRKLDSSAPRMLPALQSALFALLNLILLWMWFEVDLISNGPRADPAVRACGSVLTAALADSSFPLDAVAYALPEVMRQRLRTWETNYREKPLRKAKKNRAMLPLVLAAAARFSNLRKVNFANAKGWEQGPKVAGLLYRAPGALCCGSTAGECSFDVPQLQRELAELLSAIPSMTCEEATGAASRALAAKKSRRTQSQLVSNKDTRSSLSGKRRLLSAARARSV
jgi:hypothetical protein